MGLAFISGPCVLENEALVMQMAEFFNENFKPYFSQLDFYFKGSFDKANRSSINSYRGPGIDQGLAWLAQVKERYGFKLVTDFHLPEQAEQVASVVDILQIPAFLCRQTDMIVAGAEAAKKYGRILNVKKGQFLSPEETGNIVEKSLNFLSKDQIFLTERGTSFGYNNLIVDMSSFSIMKSFGVKTIFDATHSVQRPGALGTATGGKRENVEVLSYAAIAAGADGLFLECHPEPEKALSDAATSLPLDRLLKLVPKALKLHEIVK